MFELLGSVKPGGIARAARLTPPRSRQWAQPAREGRERAPREAIDGETGVIRCARSASPPPSVPAFDPRRRTNRIPKRFGRVDTANPVTKPPPHEIIRDGDLHKLMLISHSETRYDDPT